MIRDTEGAITAVVVVVVFVVLVPLLWRLLMMVTA